MHNEVTKNDAGRAHDSHGRKHFIMLVMFITGLLKHEEINFSNMISQTIILVWIGIATKLRCLCFANRNICEKPSRSTRSKASSKSCT